MENASYVGASDAWLTPYSNASLTAAGEHGSGAGDDSLAGEPAGAAAGWPHVSEAAADALAYALDGYDYAVAAAVGGGGSGGGYNNTTTAAAAATTITGFGGHLASGSTGEPPLASSPDDWYSWYLQSVHGWLSLAVCSFGIIANVVNVIVLSRKNMISPTNAILIGLAVADMLVMCFYLPYTLVEFAEVRRKDCVHNGLLIACRSYAAIVYTLVHANATVVFHTVSTWLTVALAIWRWIAVTFPSQTRIVCSMRRAQIAIGSTYVATAIACVPNYLAFTVHEMLVLNNATGRPVLSYRIDYNDISGIVAGVSILKFNFWTYSVLMKLVPCIALTFLSTALVRALCEADERRRRLKARPFFTPTATAPAASVSGAAGQALAMTTCPGNGGSAPPAAPPEPPPPSANQRSSDRTTRMLLAVLLLFLITEFPSGLLALLSGILGDSFFETYYLRVADLFDILALINSSVNFILYCLMSRQFRKTFALLFTPRWLQDWAPVMATEANATIATTCV